MALSSSDFGHRLLSPPSEVVWQGWTSRTDMLQRAGWQIAVERFEYGHETRLLLTHRNMGVHAITAPIPIRDIERASLGTYVTSGRPLPCFYVQQMGFDFRVQLYENNFNFVEVDMHPQYAVEPIREFDVSAFFAVPLVRTEEIIVEPQDVASMLEQIRRMQSPQMAEIRERERRRDRSEVSEREIFHAQILSFSK